MKANELMIGDWVFVPHNGRATHYGRVCGIYDSGAVSNTLEKISGLTKASSLKPIPLTPEILEKNGFEKSDCWCSFGCYYNRKIDDWKIEIYIGRIETFVKIDKGVFPHINNTDCHFLHQLQHALRLCGIEKDIEL